MSQKVLSKSIAQIMSERIRNGIWAGREKLPSEQELCDEFNVSRVTIRQAIRTLESRGLVTAQQGKGTFILRVDSMVHAGLQELKSISDSIREMGLEPSMRYLVRKIRPAAVDEAERFEIEAGASVIELGRKVYANERLVAFVEDVMPLWAFGPAFSPDSLTGSVFHYLRENTSIRPRRAIAHVHARNQLPEHWTEDDIEGAVGPYLLLDQLQYDTDDRIFMHTKAYFVEGDFDFVVHRIA